ncbi:MAG TPA: endonuclease/exonuclease/phosphatase family protein, partial [Propionibacteriaceae bacterium]|nr:endonuclease/exonuclease/phosphatase family protein [Propionibacteriaceae bacterium]
GILIIVATILPLSRSHRWWVRICDFPRFQVAVIAMGLLVLLLLTRWPFGILDFILFTAVALSAMWQVSWVWRYVPGAPLEVESRYAAVGAPERIALLTTNVLQKARDSGALLKIIGEADPDLVLAVETDEWWCSRLTEGLRARYRHSLLYPLSNGYGIAAFSRLELTDPSIRFLVDDAIPSLKTGIRLRSGAVIDLYGLHPQPPAPQQDSIERDVELVMVGKEIKRAKRPAVVLGDLNDVAWSPTTLSFKSAGGLLDPRCGRGFFNTYPAGLPGLRYPLDYIFHTPHFAVCDMRVLPRFQSDHLPLVASLCLNLK